ncbi:MAG: EAL domain-containing protein, partial [Actinomycetia bacterium]|nr:EAL domain-containing protein [Actinomycetes bacterium]
MRSKKQQEGAAFVETLPEGVVILNEQRKIVTSNARARRIFGYAGGELDDKSISFLVPKRLRRSFSDKLGKQETVGQRRDLSEFPVKLIISRISLHGEKFTVCTIHDLSAQRKAEARVAENKQAHEDMVSLSKFPIENPNPVFRINRAGEVLFANKAAKKLLKDSRSKSGTPSIDDWKQQTLSILKGDVVRKNIAMAYKNTFFSFCGVPVVKSDYVTYYGIDVTQHVKVEEGIKEVQKNLSRMAYRDSLTGLANRRYLKDRLTNALAEYARRSEMLAVLFLDLDGLKNINDAFGHDAGDYALKTVVTRMHECLRQADMAARIGGDEFVLLLLGLKKPEEASIIAERLNNKLVAEPLTIDGTKIYLSASIGISIFPADGETTDELIRNADSALYQAKVDGKGRYRFFKTENQDKARARLGLERDLREALDQDKITPFYQPCFLIKSGKILGAEALVRWERSKTQLILPADFLSVAEETGLIVPIGEMVLEKACRQSKKWSDIGFPNLKVMVNISLRQIQDIDLPNTISRILSQTGVDPSNLVIEVTENLIMRSLSEVARVLFEVRDMGIEVWMDNFGAGLATMSSLRVFPIDALKIDGSFIKYVAENSQDAAMVKAMISMAGDLGINVIAERVESQEQVSFLWEQNCEALQGFIFSQPLPAEEFTSLLA